MKLHERVKIPEQARKHPRQHYGSQRPGARKPDPAFVPSARAGRPPNPGRDQISQFAPGPWPPSPPTKAWPVRRGASEPLQPRPMNGILVAITDMNWTLAFSGRLAM